MNIFLTQSPLQVLSAFEAREHMGCKHGLLVLMLSPTKTRNNEQLLLTAQATSWEHVIICRPYKRIPMQAAVAKWHLYLQMRRLAVNGTANLFIGDFRSIWMHRARALIRPARTWLLDDGSISPAIQRDYLAQGIHWPPHRKGRLQQTLRRVANRLFGATATPGIIDVFTAFPVAAPATGQEIIRHSYTHLKSLVSTQQRKTAEIFFFGSKLSEAELISHSDEVFFLGNIARWYAQQGWQFVYIPHRGDRLRKLQALSEAGITTRSLDYPAELYFVLARNLPGGIATFFSSALNNLAMMYRFTTLDAFVLPPAAIRQTSREGIAQAYASLAAIGARLTPLAPLCAEMTLPPAANRYDDQPVTPH